ncbi:hypothetical protein [Inconstantimicrobium mannanitabidum]|uniref:Uncharacterized protein n=1 Tax=Inconstantimicrobium mannanitabidum TaxID=1604901 RepID=A0ACB5R9Z3_9CLOT|nr:hypothetical protein [Clostridium sp. TW13]GKX66014.1 hypothetical protein rsdtw13_12720 [Clostridium sp. TW13]
MEYGIKINMLNDRLQSHLYMLKRGKYEGTNKDILQRKYNLGELTFEVLHFSENNSTYLNGTKEEREAIQQSLETLEQFYYNLYKDTVCNKISKIKKFSTSPDSSTSWKRREANRGSKNPNSKHSKVLIEWIAWFKEQGYKPRQIAEILEQHGIDINKNYISAIKVSRWIYIESKKPTWFAESEVM